MPTRRSLKPAASARSAPAPVRMDVRVSRLPNGVMVATESLPELRSASLGVYLDVGSRDETPATNGLAHLFEHMVFKGTRRHSALELVKAFESSGGQVNAYTTKEQTCFYAKVVDGEVERGLDLLLDMALEATFDPAELEKEKQVIIEEIKGGNDNPEDYIYDLFSEAYYGDHGLGLPIAGTAKTVRGLGRAHLKAHQAKVRKTLPVYVVAVGRLTHGQVEDAVRKAFGLGRAAAGPARRRPRRPEAEPRPRHRLARKAVQQATALLGGPGFAWDDPRRYALLAFNCVFGEGMSSRLFQGVREQLGLVYNIYSNPEFMARSGSFSIGFATEPRNLPKAMREISREIKALKSEGLRPDELDFAKRNIRGNILLGLESSYNRMGHISRQLMGEGDDLRKALAALEAVRLDEVNAAIREIFDAKRWGSAAILPKGHKGDLASLVGF